jgi:uncharacterized protein involved in copper resistance
MSIKNVRLLALVCALFGVGLWGCGSPAEQKAPSGDSQEHDDHTGHDDHEHDDHGHDDHEHEGADHNDQASVVPEEALREQAERIEAALASLSPEDRVSAERQAVCLVTDMKLGAMGTPLKITVAGREVWMCCDGCVDELVAEPEKFLVKLQASN